MKKLAFVLLLALLIGAPSVRAAELTIASDEACDVTPGRYSIGVTNEQEIADTLRITALGAQRGWVIHDNTKIDLRSEESGTFSLSAEAPTDTAAGFYNIPIIIYSDTNESVREESSVCLIVKRVDKITVSEFSFEDDNVAPGDTAKFSITITNTGTEPFRNVDVFIDVVGPQELAFDGDTVTLMRGESTTLARETHVTNLIRPGTYSVRVTLSKDDIALDLAEKSFSIATVQRVDKSVDEDNTIVVFTKITELRNSGNVESVQTLTAEVSKPFNAFASAPGAVETSSDGKVTYTWNVVLQPGESASASYTIRYWPFIIIVAIMAYATYQFYISSKRPTVRKAVLSSKRIKDDVQEFAVALEIRNTTPITLRGIVARDFVPAVARVYKDFRVAPERAKFVEVGTELVWKIREMKPGETRIIHYKIATVAGTIDTFRLPSAVIEGAHAHRTYRVHSNELSVGSRKDKGRV